MKNLLLITILMLSIGIAGAQEKKTRKQKRAEHEAILVEQTQNLVSGQAWQFDATQMIPSTGRSRILTTAYNVTLKDGKVDSYLPFFGVAYSASYGGSDSPMIFEAPVEDYRLVDGKKGGYIIKFKAKNKNDLLDFTFIISSNGSTILGINSKNRQHISYYGDLVPLKEKEDN